MVYSWVNLSETSTQITTVLGHLESVVGKVLERGALSPTASMWRPFLRQTLQASLKCHELRMELILVGAPSVVKSANAEQRLQGQKGLIGQDPVLEGDSTVTETLMWHRDRKSSVPTGPPTPLSQCHGRSRHAPG